MDKSKLQKILDSMNSDTGLGNAFKSVENEMKRVTTKMKRDAELQATQFAKKGISELKVEMQTSLTSLVETFKVLQDELRATEQKISSTLEDKVNALRTAHAQFRTADSERIKGLAQEIGDIQASIKEISSRKVVIPDFASQISKVESDLKDEIIKLQDIDNEEDTINNRDFQDKLDKLEKDLQKVRSETMSALASHGGNANRNILVNSNPSTLSRYTDLNFKAGTNVTLTYTNNDNLKTTDLTIAATGGGGTSRNISTVSVSSMVAATASTDIVIIASAGIQLTMPTAASNTNLYTIKNTSTSSVLVNTTGGETIDTSTTLIMPVQFTSVDLISDNTNWQIT